MEKWWRWEGGDFGGAGNARASRRGNEGCVNACGQSVQIDADCFSPGEWPTWPAIFHVFVVAAQNPVLSRSLFGIDGWRPSAKIGRIVA